MLYVDPLVPRLDLASGMLESVGITSRLLEQIDCAVLLTAHADLDYALLVERCRLVFDTRNALSAFKAPNVVRL